MSQMDFVLIERADGLLELYSTIPPGVHAGPLKKLSVSCPGITTPPASPMTDTQLQSWLNSLPAGSNVKMETL